MMQMTKLKKSLSLILCIVSIAAMALFTTGCNDNNQNQAGTPSTAVQQESNVLGEGETEFYFTVIDGAGEETFFTIHTDKTMVGEALEELKLIQGEEGPYGLFVKTVNGITVDFDTDGTYWAFYVDGEYAVSGIDVTEIVADTIYSLKVEK